MNIEERSLITGMTETQQRLIQYVDSLMNLDLPKSSKLFKLWAIMELDYRGKAGEYAHKQFLTLVDGETSNFIFQLTGYLQSGMTTDKIIGLITD